MSLNDLLRRKVGVSMEAVVRRILRVYDGTDSLSRDVGCSWYGVAYDIALQLSVASGHSLQQTAAVISHLSPRATWPRNVLAATHLLLNGQRIPGVMSRSYDAAMAALQTSDPELTFTGPKTHRFYRNILGDHRVVTVDVWAARVAGVSELQLNRAGVYEGVEHAFKLAAGRRSHTPAAMQAVTWVAARGGTPEKDAFAVPVQREVA